MEKILEAIEGFKNLKGIVVGDLMLDVYSFGTVERISPEAPVPIVRVERDEFRVGGAANVASNLRALGAEVMVAGLVGEDFEGEMLIDLMESKGIRVEMVGVVKGKRTIVKNRIIARGQQLLRIDWEDLKERGGKIRKKILENVIIQSKNADFIIIEDYNKGFLDGFMYRTIIASSSAPVFIDPKFEHYSSMKNAFLVKPNFEEFRKATGIAKFRGNFGRSVETFRKKLNIKNLVVTKGEEGMYISNGDAINHIPSLRRKVFDVTGAGDMVISLLALGMCSGLSLFEASILATIGAGIEITKLGAQPVTKEELIMEVRNHWDRLLEGVVSLKEQG
uniref:D-glycero-beta-D-manno-heptose-7-phosphate kinase n=1 Tax=candidate division WOR-3 bacterium TaxID=2052148 RepID=A0A7V3ZX67_UNCW3